MRPSGYQEENPAYNPPTPKGDLKNRFAPVGRSSFFSGPLASVALQPSYLLHPSSRKGHHAGEYPTPAIPDVAYWNAVLPRLFIRHKTLQQKNVITC